MLATTMRSTTNPPNPSSTVLWGLARSTRLAAVMAWGKRPEPFRTRKLSPTAPMVLHLGGCGRVGHHRNTTKHEGPPHHQVRGPHTIHHPTHHARHHQRQLTPKPPHTPGPHHTHRCTMDTMNAIRPAMSGLRDDIGAVFLRGGGSSTSAVAAGRDEWHSPARPFSSAPVLRSAR